MKTILTNFTLVKPSLSSRKESVDANATNCLLFSISKRFYSCAIKVGDNGSENTTKHYVSSLL